MPPEKESKLGTRSLFFVIAFIFLLVMSWHVLFPYLPIALTVTATIWSVLVATIVVLCITIVMFLVFTGVGMLLFGFFAFVWSMIAITFFPVIFPLLAPLMVILLFVVFWRRRQARS